MACTRYITSLQELVDGTIGSIRRAELQQHLATCEDCRAMLVDLERIRDAAASLDPIEPPDRVWLQIAGRLRQQGRIQEAPRAAARRRYAPALALAAALVLAIGASLLVIVSRTRQAPAPAPAATRTATAPDAAAVQAAANEVEEAQRKLEQAIGHLQQVADASLQAMDPKTAATLQKNLSIIDQAIAEERAAVKAEPMNVPARESLFEALKQKVILLQDTIALMNEMRKGNPSGAAQIAGGKG
jgi:anti-sigma factor RsiW